MKRWLVIALAITVVPFLSEAGRPLTVDDAGTVESNRFQLEAGYGYEHETACNHSDVPVTLSYGLTPKVQISVGTGGQFEERQDTFGRHSTETDFDDVTLGAKAHLLDAERFWIDQTLGFAVKIPIASRNKGCGSGNADFDLTYIATKKLGKSFNADCNVGYTWVGGDDDLVHYGLALRWQAAERVELVGEVFANTPFTAANNTTVAMNVGARWQVVDSLVLDAAVGTGLRGETPDLTATIGLTWTFGFGNSK